MAEKLDAIIFGATGFTGKIVTQDAVKFFKDFKWGIAGRNKAKLAAVLKEVGDKIHKDLSHVPIILADVEDVHSIEVMASKCKIVLNCCGPYRFYGEVVVKACIEAGTHHVDISGEPQFIDGMQLKYHELAKEKGVYVVSACATESIPAEMGVVYAERNFSGTINSVEMFFEYSIDYKDTNSKALLNYGTWESVVYAMQHGLEMLRLQKQLNRETMPVLRPKLWLKPLISKPDILDSYFIPFPATDRASVLRSQRILYEFEQKRPIQFESYIGLPSIKWVFLTSIITLVLAVLAQFSFTRKLLLKYPHIFSNGILTHQGPTEANMKALHSSLTLRVKGWAKGQALNKSPNKEMLVRISGHNPLYGWTSLSLLSTAKIILKESAKMPGRGGVLPPGAAFSKTGLIEELSRHSDGMKFEILQ